MAAPYVRQHMDQIPHRPESRRPEDLSYLRIRWQIRDPRIRKERSGNHLPQCGSRERDRLYWMYLFKENILFEKNRIVQVNPDVAIKSKIKEYPRV